MDPENRRKIEQTVVDILRSTDLEQTTEFKLRATASERLGIDLSTPEHKSVVRSAVEQFLLSTAEQPEERGVGDETREAVQEEPEKGVANRELNDGGDRLICKLSAKRNVVVQDFRGKTLISIREFYRKDGQQIPTGKGISLSTEQWSAFKKNVPAIEEAIRKMESKLRTQLDGKQTEDISNSAKDISDSVTDVPPYEPRIEIDRMDGKNYQGWVQQMELLLKQLKIAYVLNEPCPSVTLGPEASTEEITQAKADEQKWKNDDYMCCRNILNSLSDHLFSLYSKKTMTAKELWEELKLVHLYEEYGTKRSQVKKYIEFQMVEEKSIVEQVQEINNIADSIVAAGMMVEEKFHVSVVISKLPPSWKNICVKLMCEEYLPFWMLMNRLGVEEELRNQGNGKMPNPAGNHPPDKDLSRMRNPKPYFLHSKKRELETDNRVVCHTCGRQGHISQNCRSKTWRRDREFLEKRNEDNGSLPATTEVNMVDGAETDRRTLDPLLEHKDGTETEVVEDEDDASATHNPPFASSQCVGGPCGSSFEASGSCDDSTNWARGRRRSEVWNHFKIEPRKNGEGKQEQKAICNYCTGAYSCTSNGGTSHLDRHWKKCLERHGGGADSYQGQLKFSGRGIDPCQGQLKISNMFGIGKNRVTT